MIYSDAVMIVEKEIDRHRKIADMYEARNNVVELIKADDERILVEALETVLKGDKIDVL